MHLNAAVCASIMLRRYAGLAACKTLGNTVWLLCWDAHERAFLQLIACCSAEAAPGFADASRALVRYFGWLIRALPAAALFGVVAVPQGRQTS